MSSPLDIALTAQNVRQGDGQGRFALELGRELAIRGHRLSVYAHSCDRELAEIATFEPLRQLPGPQILDDAAFLLSATLELRKRSHDAVVALGPTALPRGNFAMAAQFSHRGWRRSWDSGSRPAARFRMNALAAMRLEALVGRRASKIVALSREIGEDVAPGSRAEIVVVANGVDTSQFIPAEPAQRAEVRRLLGLPDAALVIGFVGEYQTARKGLEPLLEALRSGPSEERLLVAGRGPALDDRLEAMGVAEKVTVLGHAEPHALYRASDVVAVPSFYEPFSIVAVEAAASGLPVLLSRTVGAAKALGPGASIIDRPEAHLMRRALDELWSDPGRRVRMAAAARRAAEALSWERVRVPAADAVESLARANREQRGRAER